MIPMTTDGFKLVNDTGIKYNSGYRNTRATTRFKVM